MAHLGRIKLPSLNPVGDRHCLVNRLDISGFLTDQHRYFHGMGL